MKRRALLGMGCVIAAPASVIAMKVNSLSKVQAWAGRYPGRELDLMIEDASPREVERAALLFEEPGFEVQTTEELHDGETVYVISKRIRNDPDVA